MPDMEKVIKGIEHHRNEIKPKCLGCPYSEPNPIGEWCISGLLDDIYAMLKEQETLKPKKIKGYYPPMYTLYEYECERCKSPMLNGQPFCMGCGQGMNWNEAP